MNHPLARARITDTQLTKLRRLYSGGFDSGELAKKLMSDAESASWALRSNPSFSYPVEAQRLSLGSSGRRCDAILKRFCLFGRIQPHRACPQLEGRERRLPVTDGCRRRGGDTVNMPAEFRNCWSILLTCRN